MVRRDRLLSHVKIALVQPPGLLEADSYTFLPPLPLAVGYLAAYARRAGHEVEVIDAAGSGLCRVDPWPQRPGHLLRGLSLPEVVARVSADVEVIGVSSMFTHSWPMVRELTRMLRNAFPRALLVLGGENATALPELVLRETGADLCVLGEGEATFGEILERAAGGAGYAGLPGTARLDADGRFIQAPPRERIGDLDALPWPAWDLLEPENYLSAKMFMGPGDATRSLPILATRGCPFRCTFCAAERAWTPVWKARTPALVVDEIEHYVRTYGANDFQFQDMTLILRKDWIEAFCRELLRRGLRVTWSLPLGTRSEAIDAGVARLLKSAGCHHITYAPESGSEDILAAVEKRVDLEHLAESARVSLEAGLIVNLFQVIGLPQETASDIRKTFAWIRRMARLGVHELAVSPFIPLPGTRLFDEVRATHPIVVDDEFCYTLAMTSLFHVKSWNPRLSSRRLMALRILCYVQFYLISFLHHPTRLMALLRNFLFGRVETKSDRALQALWRGLRSARPLETSESR